MVDRRIRFLNLNGKIPAPGGGNQLLEELKGPVLSDLQNARLPAVSPAACEVVSPAPVMSGNKTGDNGEDVPDTLPTPTALIADQKETPRLEHSDPHKGVSFSESDGRKGIAGHSGSVLTFWEGGGPPEGAC
jgi:hypothetical protein